MMHLYTDIEARSTAIDVTNKDVRRIFNDW